MEPTHSYDIPLKRYGVGPLSIHIPAFASWLSEALYGRQTVRHKLRVMADLSLWLESHRIDVSRLHEDQLAGFLKSRGRYDVTRRGDTSTVRQVLELLRQLGAVPASRRVRGKPVRRSIEVDFERYLTEERRLAPASIVNATGCVREFLDDRFGQRRARLDKLKTRDVTDFVLGCTHRLSPRRCQVVGWALRCFFRFVYVHGLSRTDLTGAVPTIPQWRYAHLPRFIDAKQVRQVIGSCNRRTPTGRRDYAILLLLARLGLRAGEVVRLELEDIDWEAGEIRVRGKGPRQDRLPLPEDVGRALVAYLRRGRPRCETRRVFLTARAPVRPLAGQSSMGCIVSRALKRAGLEPPYTGAHLLRHSLATDMLRRGASLGEIGELLRHRHPDTTVIYAKVDLVALRTVAQPWPEG